MSFKVYAELQYVDPLPSIEETLRSTLLEIADNVVAQAKSLCPVDTGELRNSIGWEMEGKSGGFEGDHKLDTPSEPLTCYVGSNVTYAIYQECGTRYMAAQPYMRPAIAIKAQGQAFVDVMKRREEIRKSGPLKPDAEIMDFK